ncbi:hypothetical protein TRFO_02695 [Tritrichomonas foetus]|uniref:Uncharacterized protein n=1 Tax=Tritrichomonas foetus TaxID=1144522 RepID=A0A1J4L385_9EUKA|nr:hypothetical protein TRFO_02695 [Tritrichomonas foetus]|eukprot:OHT16436.1 hypothetical protein TRFO_02695 [Tritrichomonas foetus]
MNFAALLAVFLTITHTGRFIFVILSLWQFYISDQMGFFITYCVIFGLIYLIQIIIMSFNATNAILSIFSLQFIRIPFLVEKPKYRNRIVYFTCIEILNSMISGYLSAYLVIQTDRLPIWITIPHLVLSCLDVSIYYDGVMFNSPMVMTLASYIVITLEFFLTTAFTSVLITLKRFWIAFCAGFWRLIIAFEPFAFWCSLQTAISPFRAMSLCISARSLVAVYLLYMEMFLMIYITCWLMEKTVLNQVFAYIYAVYYLIFVLIQLCSNNLPFTHKIRPITLAMKEEPQLFDPAVL